MAPLPKRRHSSRRQAKRNRALNIAHITWVKCKQCGEPCRPHTVCKNCGYYGGNAVVVKKQKKEKKG